MESLKEWDWNDEECKRSLWQLLFDDFGMGRITQELSKKYLNYPKGGSIRNHVAKPEFIQDFGALEGIGESQARLAQERMFGRSTKALPVRPTLRRFDTSS